MWTWRLPPAVFAMTGPALIGRLRQASGAGMMALGVGLVLAKRQG